MAPAVTISMPAIVRDDFVDEFGWDKLVEGLGERKGMKDAWTAVQFARPRGTGATYVVSLHPLLVPVLKTMVELRWADHYSVLGELATPYDRVLEQLTKLARKKPR